MPDAIMTSPMRSVAAWTTQWVQQLRGKAQVAERTRAESGLFQRGYTPMRDGGVVGFSTCVVALTAALNDIPGAREAFVDLVCVEDALLLCSTDGLQLVPYAVLGRAIAQLGVLINASKASRVHQQALEALLVGLQGGWKHKALSPTSMDFFGRRRASAVAKSGLGAPTGTSSPASAWMDTVPEEPPGWADTSPADSHG